MRVERVPFRLISAATAAILLAACGPKQSAPPQQTPEVGIVTVQPTAVPVVTELPGRTNAFLAAQVRAQYTIGRADELRLLLSQTNPAEAGRMVKYYGYFARLRAARIEEIDSRETRVAELQADTERTQATAGLQHVVDPSGPHRPDHLVTERSVEGQRVEQPCVMGMSNQGHSRGE